LTARFMDVSVQRQQWLHLLDQPADCDAADGDGDGLPARVDRREIRLQLRGAVEPAVVWGNVQVEDRSLRLLELVGERTQPLVERVLVQLARAIPRRRV